ncbi:hypothetical protein AB833_08770 [Chromatiales bacterium (ex Bugula neritina AB1)]|nr:hypothetical protein AB833_08770 [Chromatiales bacterium (ex Bugula neritina AB1)]
MIRVGVDWGSSTFRAYHFDENANIIDSLTRPLGIKQVNSNSDTSTQFEDILFTEVGSWLQSGDSVLLSGMITSANGWHETEYLECPADIAAIGNHLGKTLCRGVQLLFVPGICQRSPYADVMRGEELQLLGTSSTTDAELVVMPGTHSKWASMDHGTIQSFRTIPTGELYQILLHNSLIGQLATPNDWLHEHFIAGLELGHKTNRIISELFSCRANVLMKQLPEEGVRSYLSGLLIGAEINEGRILQPSSTIKLIGDDMLCDRYQTAIEHLGLTVSARIIDASVQGFSRLITDIKQR